MILSGQWTQLAVMDSKGTSLGRVVPLDLSRMHCGHSEYYSVFLASESDSVGIAGHFAGKCVPGASWFDSQPSTGIPAFEGFCITSLNFFHFETDAQCK